MFSGNIIFYYMYKDEILAHVKITEEPFKCEVINFTDIIILRPFGVNENPSLQDLLDFYESRCFPKERRNCQELLEDFGLDEYIPSQIILKTHGRQLEDFCWIKFEGEDLEYERDIKLR